MVLIYAYIEKYKNFRSQGFPLHSEYHVDFHEGILKIQHLGTNPVHQMLYEPNRVRNIRLVVGKTGAGKTNLFQLIGEDEEHRAGHSHESPLGFMDNWAEHETEGSYFFLYAKNPDQYYIECKDMYLPQFSRTWTPLLERLDDSKDNSVKSAQESIRKETKNIENLQRQIKTLRAQGESGIKSAKGLEKRLAEHQDTLEFLHNLLHHLETKAPDDPLLWTAHFSHNENGDILISDNDTPQDTLILNCYDQTAFSKHPYPDRHNRGFRQGQWVLRVQAPFQQATLWNMCRYIREYTRTVEPGELKKQVTLQISNLNFEHVIIAPVEEEKKILWRYSRSAKSSESADRISNKDMFLHDLWVDYCLYLLKKDKQIAMFPLDESDVPVLAYREAYNYMLAIGNLPFAKAAEQYAEHGRFQVDQFCSELARHLDRPGRTEGLLNQICDDIKDIVNLMRRLDDKYFTPSTFEMSVEDMELPQNRDIIYDMFERMESYHVDDMDLFDRCLLPYHFTRLSTGELKYARVFGVIYDYLATWKLPESISDCIFLLDEPDACLHPELSRRFLSKLLTVCRGIDGKRHFQLLVSTHSPLILSDVPGDAVLRLGIDPDTGNGIVLPPTGEQYFGANIHSIMADGFFLNSTIGEFSRAYLQQVQDRLRELMTVLQSRELSPEERQWLDSQRPVLDAIGDQLIRRGFALLLEQIDKLTGHGE